MKKFRTELRADGGVRLTGYVNVVERDSRTLNDEEHGDFIECIAQGAFADALDAAGDTVRLMYNHRRDIGRRGDNLELVEDAIGLYADATIYDAEVVNAAADERLQGWSFGFHALADKWEVREGDNNTKHRRVLRLLLDEVSILDVTPAYSATSVEQRSGDGKKIEYRASECKVSAAHVPAKDRNDNRLATMQAELYILKPKGENKKWN